MIEIPELEQRTVLSTAELKTLLLIAENQPVMCKQLARRLWPDSKAWTRMVGGYNGYPGKTMAAKAGGIAWRLERHGLVAEDANYAWSITLRGVRFLEAAKRAGIGGGQ